MKIKALILSGILACGAMTVRVARATTMVSMSMQQLTEASSDIVQAHVVSQVSAWNSTHTQILTFTTMAVTQTLKGNVGATVQVRQLGGTVGNLTVSVPGDVALKPQREYILFLEPSGGSNYRVVGMSQGAFTVYQDAISHDERVILSANQAQLQTVFSSAGNPAGTAPLLGFRKYVATLVNAGIQIPHGLNIPVSVASTESRGTGRMHVYGRTTAQLFPNQEVVIPVGSEVEGEAVRNSTGWTIHWDEVSVRGVHAGISAVSYEADGSWRGQNLILSVR